MAMKIGSGGGTSDPDVMVDINTTPLIDVMLVLLIMLIITIPIQTHAVKLNMPVGTPPPPDVPPQVVTIEVDFDGTMVWNGGNSARSRRSGDASPRRGRHGGPARSASAAEQAREVRERGDADGLRAAAGLDEDRADRPRAVHPLTNL